MFHAVYIGGDFPVYSYSIVLAATKLHQSFQVNTFIDKNKPRNFLPLRTIFLVNIN